MLRLRFELANRSCIAGFAQEVDGDKCGIQTLQGPAVSVQAALESRGIRRFDKRPNEIGRCRHVKRQAAPDRYLVRHAVERMRGLGHCGCYCAAPTM